MNTTDSTMPLKRKGQAQVTREAILDSAELLFALDGFSKTTLDRIARHANLSRGAIYANFRNKGEVFDAMLDRAWHPIHESLAGCTVDAAGSTLCALRDVFVSAIRSLGTDDRRRRVTEILLNKSEFVDDNARTVELIRLNAESAIWNIKRVLRQGITQEQLSADLDVAVIAQVIHSQFSGVVHDILRFPQVSSLDRGLLGMTVLFTLIEKRYAKVTSDV